MTHTLTSIITGDATDIGVEANATGLTAVMTWYQNGKKSLSDSNDTLINYLLIK